MIQLVRRKPVVSPESKVIPVIKRKARKLELALVSLAAANLFALSSALSFYFLAHNL